MPGKARVFFNIAETKKMVVCKYKGLIGKMKRKTENERLCVK